MTQQVLNELLTPAEVALRIRRSYRTVIRLLEEGKIEYYRPTPRTYLISESALRTYLESTKNS